MQKEYYEGLSDDELIALSRDKDDRATETLMSRYKGLVRSRARSMFILGGDSLVDFHGWKEPQRICDACTLAVAVRNHMPADAFDAEIRALQLRYHARVEKLHTGNIDISSSELRARIREGRSVRYFIPEASAAYIEKNRIYSC